jgi:hypothetical protein
VRGWRCGVPQTVKTNTLTIDVTKTNVFTLSDQTPFLTPSFALATRSASGASRFPIALQAFSRGPWLKGRISIFADANTGYAAPDGVRESLYRFAESVFSLRMWQQQQGRFNLSDYDLYDQEWA